MKAFVALVAVCCSQLAFASVPVQITLEEMAQCADHILVGHVVGVDMIDEHGETIADMGARTGPGLKNTIRLYVAVDDVLVTNAEEMPDLLKVPLDPFMHYSLGQIEKAHDEPSAPFLVLLRGPSFLPIVPGAFLVPLDEKKTALRVHAEEKMVPDDCKARSEKLTGPTRH